MNYSLPAATGNLALNPLNAEEWGSIADPVGIGEDWGSITDQSELVCWESITDPIALSGLVSWLSGHGYAMAAYGASLSLESADVGFRYGRRLLVSVYPMAIGKPSMLLRSDRRMPSGPSGYEIVWQKVDTPSQYKVPGSPFELTMTRYPATFHRTYVLGAGRKDLSVAIRWEFFDFLRNHYSVKADVTPVQIDSFLVSMRGGVRRRIFHIN